MPKESAPFKGQKRGQRVQSAEAVFNAGMYYSNMPLKEGFAKELVNYDTKDQGELLEPRPGLRVFDHSLYSGAVAYNQDMTISHAQESSELDGERYQQIIISQITDTPIAGTNLVSGTGYIGTGKNNVLALNDMHAPGADLIFKKPKGGEIHGIPVDDLNVTGRQVGTFAFNEYFYFFRTDGKLYRTYFNNTSSEYEVEEVVPTDINAREAVLWGYNLLEADPYTFDDEHDAAILKILGITVRDEDSNLIVNPIMGNNLELRAHYDCANAGDKFTVVWSYKELTSDEWITIRENDIIFSGDPVLRVTDWNAPSENVIIDITTYAWPGGVKDTVPTQTLQMRLTLAPEERSFDHETSYTPKVFDLSTAAGMAYWKRRLILYGIKEHQSKLFMSRVNDPTYFAYPNDVDDLEEPIIHVTSLLDQLIVFTTTKIHSVVLSADGLTTTRTVLQSNLNINEWDTHLIQNIKNMIYFRSGNYYYMIVPSRALAGSLTVAPISKNIEELFNKFESSVEDIVKTVYDYAGTLNLVNYYNYLDFEDVCNTYVYQTDADVYLNIVLLYDTMLRGWRIRAYESQSILIPYKQDITKRGELVGLLEYNSKPSVQFLKPDELEVKDYYYPNGLTDLSDAPEVFAAQNVFKNYQYIDTGYRDIASVFKKRFRELQFRINNLSQTRLNFYSEFLIDGNLRSSKYNYNIAHNIDPEDENYGVITMERELVDPTVVPGVTILAETEDETNMWQLDVSQFPDLAFWKVRMPVSGKGYAPRLKLISYNEERYELLDLHWVFRPLYSR